MVLSNSRVSLRTGLVDVGETRFLSTIRASARSQPSPLWQPTLVCCSSPLGDRRCSSTAHLTALFAGPVPGATLPAPPPTPDAPRMALTGCWYYPSVFLLPTGRNLTCVCSPSEIRTTVLADGHSLQSAASSIEQSRLIAPPCLHLDCEHRRWMRSSSQL